MRKTKITGLTALTLSATMALTGCNSFINNDVTKYPLVPALTTQEVVDYYAKAMDYDAVVSKNVTVHETNYATQDISGSKEEILKSLVSQAEGILGKNEYEYTEDNARIISADTFNYIKSSLDNEVLSNGSITQMKGALGYYFVDVKYNISAKTPGTFNQMTSLLGLDGVWLTQYDGTYKLDVGYLQTTVRALNKYYAENNIMKCATFSDSTGTFEVLDGVAPDVAGTYSSNTNVDNTDMSTVVTEEDVEAAVEDAMSNIGENTETTDESTSEEVSNDENSEETTDENNESTDSANTNESESSVVTPMEFKTTSYNSIVSSDRKVQLDIDLINKVVGTSLHQKSFLPSLDLVYNKPEAEGTISGYGIYTAGANGLKLFGFDRNALSGTVTLRYVFKDDAAASGDIVGTNVYVLEEEITTGTNVSDQNVIIPDFLRSQFEQLIERADRVQSDVDLSGMLNGKIYEDMGFAVLAGYKNEGCRTLKNMSTIRQIISRDTENNAYLLEIETTIMDGPRSVDCYGNYRDKSYVVVQQQGNQFVISDQIRVSREVSNEAPINPDSATEKRLVALNLAGEIDDETKSDILKLMSDLYTAGTNRLMYAHDDEGNLKTITVNGQEVTLERGMYDCFDSDPTMLSSDELEYMNSQLRNKLVKYGVNTPAVYSGTVTNWIGGYDNQAEFMTEELITYSGKGTGYYMQVYYLVSKMNDTWVIDERTIIDENEVEGTNLDNIKSRVGQ